MEFPEIFPMGGVMEGRLRLTAKDIMRRNVVTVSVEADLWEVARVLTSNSITGAPVLDEEGELVGVVSQTDIVRHLQEVAQASSSRGDFFKDPEHDGAPAAHRWLTARDLMSPVANQAGEDTPVQELGRIMTIKRIHRIIITRESRIVGIVTSMDLLKVL